MPGNLSNNLLFNEDFIGSDLGVNDVTGSVVPDANALVATLRTARPGFINGSSGFSLDLPFNIDPFEYFTDDFVETVTDTTNADSANTTQDYRLRDVDSQIKAISADEAAALNAEALLGVSASVLSANTDRLLAIITQDMSAFGVKYGDNDSTRRNDSTNRPVDFFA